MHLSKRGYYLNFLTDSESLPMSFSFLVPLGRTLFAVAIITLGLEHLITGTFPVGLLPVSPDIPARLLLAYLMGTVLTAGGVGLLLGNRQAALITGGVLLLLALLLHVPRWLANPYDGRVWTVLFELIALAGGAMWQASAYHQTTSAIPATDGLSRLAVRYGPILFAVSLLVFGGLHLVYGPFVATLIPTWIPGHLFWAYFVGVAFLATGVSILLNKQVFPTTFLLGVMFGLWVLLLHGPRVVAAPRIEAEWTSLLVALAMSGLSLTLAGAIRSGVQPIRALH